MIESITLYESAGALYCIARTDDGNSIDCHAIAPECEHDWDRAELDGYAARGCTLCGTIEPVEEE